MPETDAFALITAGQEPRLQCVIRACTVKVQHAAICRNCRAVEYACGYHLAVTMRKYAEAEAYGIAAGTPVHWHMGCCGAIAASFGESLEVVGL